MFFFCEEKMVSIYIVRCEDDSLYTGITRDLGERMRAHYYKKKHGAKYTRSRQIQSLEMVWETENWSDAAKLEYRIKRLSHSRKEELINCPGNMKEFFGDQLEGIVYEPHPERKLLEFLSGKE